MGVRSRRSNPKRRRRAASAAVSVGDDDGVDLISGLNDDLLLRILDLVPDAENVVRTHALSRRWRGLWTGVSALRFDFSCWREPRRSDAAAAVRYIAFVNGALALRAAAAAKDPAFVDDLAISFDISDQETGQLVPVSAEAAQGWIRYAVQQQQHTVKSFVLKLMLPWRRLWRFNMDHDDSYIEHPAIERPVMNLDEIENNFARMETMHLRLGGVQLQLPSSSTVVFPSLVDLSLEEIEVPAADGGYLLSRLLSSACCPRLHKVRLEQLSFGELYTPTMEEVMLRIEADTLLELSLDSMFRLQFLEVRTPRLQVLHIKDPFNLNGFIVSAPRLENLKFCVRQPCHIDDVLAQLSSVGTLKIRMSSHGEADYQDRNAASIHLLQCCRLIRCLEVSFEIIETKYQTIDMIKGRIPLLPHVTHLTVDIKLWERHSTGPGVACLLAQCSNIKYLRLHLCYITKKRNQSELDLLCDNNSCHWRSHEFSLDHLEKVEFKDLMGTDCEFQFIQSILTKATGIRKVTISFDRFYWRKGRKPAFKLMPPLDGGLWTTCKDYLQGWTCMWRRRL